MATASDDFAGTGATSADWDVLYAGLERYFGNLISTTSFGLIERNDITPGPAQISSIIWGTPSGDIYNGRTYIGVRSGSSGGRRYYADVNDGRHGVQFYRVYDDDPVALGSEVDLPADIAEDDEVSVEIDADFLLTFRVNGVSIATYDDAAHGLLTSGRGHVRQARGGFGIYQRARILCIHMRQAGKRIRHHQRTGRQRGDHGQAGCSLGIDPGPRSVRVHLHEAGRGQRFHPWARIPSDHHRQARGRQHVHPWPGRGICHHGKAGNRQRIHPWPRGGLCRDRQAHDPGRRHPGPWAYLLHLRCHYRNGPFPACALWRAWA